MNAGPMFDLASSTTVVLGSVSAVGEVNGESAFEFFSSIAVALGSISVGGEVF